MADEIFCSEAWARSDLAEIAHAGAGSYLLASRLAKAQEHAALCRYLPSGVVPVNDGLPVRTTIPILW